MGDYVDRGFNSV
jgi:serine/threonine-protein phosphatase 2A catalytic subunit